MPPAEGATPLHAVPLDERDLDPDPLVFYRRWFDEAAAVLRAPEAMALSTVSASGMPSLRMVLAKGFDAQGFSFFTNYGSRKGLEIEENPHGALLFYWDPLGRQVRLEGEIERLEPAASDAYFASRPRATKIGAHASEQSRPVGGRAELDERVKEAAARFSGRVVSRPRNWGGFRLVPRRYEFWQHREDRLHDRLVYELDHQGWRITRLQP